MVLFHFFVQSPLPITIQRPISAGLHVLHERLRDMAERRPNTPSSDAFYGFGEKLIALGVEHRALDCYMQLL